MRALLLSAAAGLVASAGPLMAAPQYGSYDFDAKGMDKAVKPGDDFFTFANGTWDKKMPIPAE